MTIAVDVAIIGAGVIGLAIADELAAAGRSVCLIDSGQPGREASWAASGSLALIMPDIAPPLIRPLAARSSALWPKFAEVLQANAGMPIEYQNSGLLRLAMGDEEEKNVGRTESWLREHDIRIDRIDAATRRALSPIVGDHFTAAWHQPHLTQVRPPRLLRALMGSTARRGLQLRANDPVLDLLRQGDRVIGVRTASETVSAGEVILAAGAWSGEFARKTLGVELPVTPVRGQILLLEGPPVYASPLLLGAKGSYLIPRADGRILAGSTFEHVGFDRSVTVAGTRSILEGAMSIAPSLANARVVASWAGLRPESPDRLPYLGRIAGLGNLVFATGHFRDGILLAPVTAEIVRAILDGKPQSVDINAFSPERKIVPVA